jgi:L-ascorbate metabolism protein UlaG (beta-lactamase superfamily)
VTPQTAAKRLGGNSTGLAPFESTKLGAYTITATPARHGPPGSLPIVGPVIGFIIEGPSLKAPIYISGDTVWFDGVAEVAKRWKPGVAFLHLGCVKFGISGPLRYTFDAGDAVRAANAFGDALIVPVHYEGWSHFTQGRKEFESGFSSAGIASRVRWLDRGTVTDLG